MSACGLVAIAAALPTGVQADTKLVAQYAIAVAGISIGQGDLVAEIGPEIYTAHGGGRAAGFLRILVGGEGQVAAHGRMLEGKPQPEAFSATLDDENERTTVAMRFDRGAVKDLSAESSAPREDRVPVTAEHRRDVIDPVSAMLVPAGGADLLAPTACQRTLPIFDGQRRYDLKLSFKRIDNAKDIQGYRGAVIVCAVSLVPIAGHRAGSALVKYLAGGRALELWLAPIQGTRLLGPYRLSVANLIGDLTITATRYEISDMPALPALRPSIAAEPSAVR